MEPGDTVPDFSARTQDGETVTLTDLLVDGPVVLFFYPKAFTGGCTAEACHFRDLAAEFEAVGATPVGISRDDVETQAAFGEKHDLGYPLLSDPDGSVAKVFGAKRIGPLWSKRHTFVIDTDRTVRHATQSESDMEVHADEALEVLSQLQRT
ncbi:MAG: peroxiredoxin [Nitriliruptorales bacterium]|nr:peroxiredoxin [Nitriliruptorales bacterium]